jgi:hypothetical protein
MKLGLGIGAFKDGVNYFWRVYQKIYFWFAKKSNGESEKLDKNRF